MISPCVGCRGSSAFIHFTCMQAHFRQRGEWTNLDCPTCKHAYEGVAAVELAKEGLLKVGEEGGKETLDYLDALLSLMESYRSSGNHLKASEAAVDALALAERVVGQHGEVGLP